MANGNQAEKHDAKVRAESQKRGRRSQANKKFDLKNVDWLAIIALTSTLCDVGGALRFGLTRDGGAVALGIYLGEDYGTEYIKPDEDFHDACREISRAWLPSGDGGFDSLYQRLVTAG